MSVSPDHASQSGFAYRFEWGLDGLDAIAGQCDVVVVVDVLRFTSAVSAAVDAGATIFPFRWGDERAVAHAAERNAALAGPREAHGPSLSPTDLLLLDRGTRVVLPSPNGSPISLAAADLDDCTSWRDRCVTHLPRPVGPGFWPAEVRSA